MPDFHRLNKSRTTEMSKEELNRKLREQAERSEKNAQRRDPSAQQSRRQKKISEQTRKQLPPQSPVRQKREEELRRQEKEARKARKRRRRGSNVVYYVMLAFIASTIFIILSLTVLFNTERIIIEGESDYTDEQIIAASGLKGDENLVRLNTSGIPQKILDKLITLDSVKVDKVFPSTIKITVERSVPMANFFYNGSNYVISHIGRVMEISNTRSDNCMQVIGYVPAESVIAGAFISAADPEQDKLISEISAAVEKTGLEGITTVDISDNIGIVLSYRGRIDLLIGSILQIDQKLRIAKELITGGYIAETERVTLDISDTSKAIQRPITSAPLTAAPPETTYETDENGDPIIPEGEEADTIDVPAVE